MQKTRRVQATGPTPRKEVRLHDHPIAQPHVSHDPTGQRADGILARLKRDDPALAEQVIAGELTANAAALRKGWRKPRVLLTAPNSVAAQVRKHFTDDEIRDLITELEALL